MDEMKTMPSLVFVDLEYSRYAGRKRRGEKSIRYCSYSDPEYQDLPDEITLALGSSTAFGTKNTRCLY